LGFEVCEHERVVWKRLRWRFPLRRRSQWRRRWWLGF